MPGTGPGSRVTLPPAALICSADLYTSCGGVDGMCEGGYVNDLCVCGMGGGGG